ncbi:unnamed protein product [Chironomus riparius]|uniref:ASD2 domain-containing protein n=1 Tax=Chironomus riparius TaxID=315576 RepID=A0A9N9RUV6_9DIPT|nr:unnamed protein product [Chironomus riparius]
MNSNSTTSKIVATKKNGNNLNSSIRFRNSSSDISINHRKSFPSSSSSDLCSSLNSNTQSNEQLNGNNQYILTQAGLEEYSRSYYDQNVIFNHQKQSSYAQSEGYHSYVSSSDSTSTPFLDRLRQESHLIQSRGINWSQDFQTQNLNGSTNSISSSTGNIRECSESNSSTETLKWLGSMSDVSVVSQATNTSTLSAASSQLIVHSSKVHTPQRHNSESVLYMNEESICSANSAEDPLLNNSQQRSSRSDNRLFPISTYIESSAIQNNSLTSPSLPSPENKLANIQQWQSVADRISELENQQQVIHDHNRQNYTYLDPSKTNRIPSSTLKAFQKNAVQSYFERQQLQQQSLRLSKSKLNVENDDVTKLRINDQEKMNYNLRLSNTSLAGNSPPSPSFSTSQRSSLPNWPSDASSMIGINSNIMMRNKNDVAKKNMKNNAISSAMPESQLHQIVNDTNQTINTTFTSFCEIKTENCNSTNATSVQTCKNSDINLNTNAGDNIPPPPLPRKSSILRRTSSASEYSSTRDRILHQSQHLSKDLLAPMILGKIISIDDWVPERPPKPKSRPGNTMPLRVPSPDLPPPPIDTTIPLSEQDENLPLPPLEVLKQDYEMRMNHQPSRRNSFAGQGSLPPKVIKNVNIHLSPPAIPMRPKIVPTPIMTINTKPTIYQPTQDHTVLAQRAVVQKQCSNEQITFNHHEQDMTPPRVAPNRLPDQRISIRKRAHNSSPKDCIGYSVTPPPLKPRMRNQNESNTQTQLNVVNNNKVRSNSKASYLPRQQRDKLLDPDHGSYKLTLHELSDNINVEYQEDLTKCNLPDVLPVNVKYHNSYRNAYHYHNHMKSPHFHSSDSQLVPQSAPTLGGNPMKSIFHFQMSNNLNSMSPPSTAPVQSISSSPSFNNGSPIPAMSPQSTSLQSPKYTSQSTIDLKMTQVIDPKLYTNEELIKAYHQQKETCRELNKTILCNSLQSIQSLNECDNKIAVVRKLNMVESPEESNENLNDTKNTSTESLEEKAMNEKSEKQIKIEKSTNSEIEEEPLILEETDESKVMQKTEITLTVRPIIQDKIDMACQTEESQDSDKNISLSNVEDESLNKDSTNFTKLFTPNQRPEEFDCEKLSKDLISQLSPSDKLHNILVPKTVKSSADYISDLFKINVTIRPTKKDVSTSTLEKTMIKSSMEMLTSNSTYFSTSEPKAKLMTRYSREMTLINSDSSDLTKKKEELVERLGKKLKILEAEQTILAEESSINESLGHEVAFKVAQKLKPGDSTKFRSYVDDIGYITMLLLSLSGRLARIENALHTIGEKSTDKKILENKRDRLLEQLDEAKSLKEDIDRRGTNLSKILEKSLTQDEYADYDYFINMKAKLIVDSREIADKIKLGEEQLNALKDTLVHSEC